MRNVEYDDASSAASGISGISQPDEPEVDIIEELRRKTTSRNYQSKVTNASGAGMRGFMNHLVGRKQTIQTQATQKRKLTLLDNRGEQSALSRASRSRSIRSEHVSGSKAGSSDRAGSRAAAASSNRPKPQENKNKDLDQASSSKSMGPPSISLDAESAGPRSRGSASKGSAVGAAR